MATLKKTVKKTRPASFVPAKRKSVITIPGVPNGFVGVVAAPPAVTVANATPAQLASIGIKNGMDDAEISARLAAAFGG